MIISICFLESLRSFVYLIVLIFFFIHSAEENKLTGTLPSEFFSLTKLTSVLICKLLIGIISYDFQPMRMFLTQSNSLYHYLLIIQQPGRGWLVLFQVKLDCYQIWKGNFKWVSYFVLLHKLYLFWFYRFSLRIYVILYFKLQRVINLLVLFQQKLDYWQVLIILILVSNEFPMHEEQFFWVCICLILSFFLSLKTKMLYLEQFQVKLVH